MGPLKAFVFKSSDTNLMRSPTEGGINPDRAQANFKEVKLDKPEIWDGMIPVIDLVFRDN
jgi:hypothetical protein